MRKLSALENLIPYNKFRPSIEFLLFMNHVCLVGILCIMIEIRLITRWILLFFMSFSLGQSLFPSRFYSIHSLQDIVMKFITLSRLDGCGSVMFSVRKGFYAISHHWKPRLRSLIRVFSVHQCMIKIDFFECGFYGILHASESLTDWIKTLC